MEKLESIAIIGCAVSRCKNELKALIVAANGNEVKKFPACERHYKGVKTAVDAKFGDNGYLVACYTELMRK